ncbi:hypothetical protein ACFL40_06340 [candidate division KSB1 bacterium]
MKRYILTLFLAAVVIGFNDITTHAQQKEQPPQLWLIGDILTKPSEADEYESVIKEWTDYSTAYQYPFRWFTHRTYDFHYYLCFPIKSFDDIDDVFSSYSNMMVKNVGQEERQALNDRNNRSYEWYRYYLQRYQPGLSYIPENPRLKPGEGNATHANFIYILPDKEREFRKILREWAELYKTKNIPDGYEFYIGLTGTEKPVYFRLQRAKNRADYYSRAEIIKEMLGEEGEALMKRTLPLIRRIERKDAVYCPELSYKPKK